MKHVLAVVVLCSSVWAADWELKADKATYAPGETVTLKFKNNSNGMVELGDNWPAIYNEGGEVVYSPFTIQIVVGVPPGNSHPANGWKWKQLDNDEKPVPSGKYTAKLKVYPLNANPVVLETSFTIAEPMWVTGLHLTTDKPIYKAGVAGAVKITIKNTSSTPILLASHDPWRVKKGSQVVYEPVQLMIWPMPFSLAPGQSMTYSWSKKNMMSQFVSPGSYRIEIGLYGASNVSSRTVALTKTGTLAGNRWVPLALGNLWNYFPTQVPPNAMVAPYSSQVKAKVGPWYQITYPMGQNEWVRLTGVTYPTLQTVPNPFVTVPAGDLFRFNRPLGYEYAPQYFGTVTKLRVGATNDTVTTPAGTFKGCYRLDAVATSTPDGGSGSYWFAKGIGLVKSSDTWLGSPLTFELHHATIRHTDGKMYTIGLE